MMILQNKMLALINEVLGQTAKLRKGGNQATYFCPKCNHYKRKLEISLETGQYHCWVCHFRGAYLGSLLTKVKAAKHYRDQLFDLTKDVRLQRRKSKLETDEEKISLPVEFISLTEPPKPNPHYAGQMQDYRYAMAYLKKRDITLEDICRYNIGYCTEGEYKDCIVVPSYDCDGNLNYFSCRYYFQHKWLKYKNAPFSKNIVGFECFINYEEPVTLVEGAFDAIAVRVNAVPLFGTLMSTKLKESLVINKTPRINLVLDNDAMKEALDAIQELWRWNIPVHLVKLDEKDPSEIGFFRIHDMIQKSNRFTFEDLIYSKLTL